MSQGGGIHLETSVGYALKEASSALRAAMERALRPLGMTVTHYACLELLGQCPGMSNSDLARGTFITRQSMSALLYSLERDGSITRAASPDEGRVLPVRLTSHGEQLLTTASAAVRTVEESMLRGIPDSQRTILLELLRSMTRSLRTD